MVDGEGLFNPGGIPSSATVLNKPVAEDSTAMTIQVQSVSRCRVSLKVAIKVSCIWLGASCLIGCIMWKAPYLQNSIAPMMLHQYMQCGGSSAMWTQTFDSFELERLFYHVVSCATQLFERFPLDQRESLTYMQIGFQNYVYSKQPASRATHYLSQYCKFVMFLNTCLLFTCIYIYGLYHDSSTQKCAFFLTNVTMCQKEIATVLQPLI